MLECLNLKVLSLCLIVGMCLCADDKDFARIGTDDGLSQSFVRSIMQDEYGYIWFGTKEGLNKYDGHRISVYRQDSGNSRGLENTSINEVYIDKLKQLWVCTLNGVYLYDRKLDRFHTFESLKTDTVNCMVQTQDGNYWFGTTSGLYFYNSESQFTTQVAHAPKGSTNPKNESINALFEDRYGDLWVQTQAGCDVFNHNLKTFYHPTDIEGPEGLGESWIHQIIEDKSGQIWIGIFGGLYKYKRRSRATGDGVFKRIITSNNGFKRMVVDQENNLWVGHGSSGGISIWDLTNLRQGSEPIEVYKNDQYNQQSLSDNSIESMFLDKSGGIWIGTYGNGVSYFSDDKKPFSTVNLMEVAQNLNVSNQVNIFYMDDSSTWIGTENGLLRWDKKTAKYNTYHNDPDNPSSLGGNAVYAIEKDSRGNLWVGSWNGGLSLYQPESDSFIVYKHDFEDSKSIKSNHVFSIFEDSSNRLWIGTIAGGLNEFHYDSKTFTHHIHDPNDETSISNSSINDIEQTPDGSLWISTYRTIDSFNPETGIFRPYSNTGGPLRQNQGDLEELFVDSLGQLWLGTEVGLIHFDPTEENYTKYTTTDGLPNNTIKTISEDKLGNLWITTNMGLSKFVNGLALPDDPEFINFDRSDGLQGNEFVKRSKYISSDGTFYIGGTNGFTSFIPSEIKQSDVMPEVQITDLYLLNKKIHPEKDSEILDTETYLLDKLILNYDDTIFGFGFSAIDFPQSHNIEYTYMLEGFDKEWRNVGTSDTATYTNINPGNYTFKVKSSNADGLWGDNVASIQLQILPPWWMTTWFRVGSSIFVLSLLLGIYKLSLLSLQRSKTKLEKHVKERTSELSRANLSLADAKEELSHKNEELTEHKNTLETQVKDRTRELEKAKNKAEESDRLKSAFLANMSHEIRTPLNAILGFSDLIAMQAADNKEFEIWASRIGENSEMLVQLLNDIIDFSIMEAGQLQIDFIETNAKEIFNDLEEEFKHIVSGKVPKEVSFIADYQVPLTIIPMIRIDRIRLRQILMNLVTNACKFTENGFIKFGTKLTKNQTHLEYSVQDTGIGIKTKDQEMIFDRFAKIVDDSRPFIQGTGLGLSISKSLSLVMGCTIRVNSEPGEGSCFTLSVPILRLDSMRQFSTVKRRIKSSKFEAVDWNEKTILVAEDVEYNYALIENYLSGTGVKLIHATNGEEAIKHFKDLGTSPDLLLFDIKMPKVNGNEALIKIREISPEVPAIAQTAHALKSEMDDILDAGFQYCITKPLHRDELLNAISSFI